MNDNSKFWLGCWILVSLVTITGFITITICEVNEAQTIRKMVNDGVDPIKAGCAFHYRNPVCLIIGSK